ncbi:MAG: hypothetical protein ABID38_02050 [Candidatus Diapherotrites archaeon]
MALFEEAVLSKERVNALDKFVKGTISTLLQLADEAETKREQELYERMAKEVSKINLLFYDKKALKSEVMKKDGKLYGYAVMGEHVTNYLLETKGDKKKILKQEYINMPAEHVFHGNQIRAQGALTLWHEYGHFPKSHFRRYIERLGIPPYASEEAGADFLAAKVARSQGFSEDLIKEHSKGRVGVFGRSFPRYWKILEGIVTPTGKAFKKAKKPIKTIWEKAKEKAKEMKERPRGLRPAHAWR